MKLVLDADLLSTFARIKRLDILNSLFEKIILPQSVISELGKAEIKISENDFEIAKLTREELLALKKMDARLGRGERECLAIAENRKIPLATSDRLVHSVCRTEKVSYFTLPRLLRLAISKNIVNIKEAKELL
jgi:predicted nucleic acid-binding protein